MSNSRDKGKARVVTPPLEEASSLSAEPILIRKDASPEKLPRQSPPPSVSELAHKVSSSPVNRKKKPEKKDYVLTTLNGEKWEWIDEFPSGGAQTKGTFAGTYKHNDEISFAKRNDETPKSVAEFLASKFYIGLAERHYKAAKDKTPKITLARSPNHPALDFPDETGEHIYLVIPALKHYSKLISDVTYANGEDVADKRPDVISHIAPNDDQLKIESLDKAIKAHRYDQDLLAWFLIMTYILGDLDIHLENLCTVDPWLIRDLVKATQDDMSKTEVYFKVKKLLSAVILQFEEKKNAIQKELSEQPSKDETTKQFLITELIKYGKAKAEFDNLSKELENNWKTFREELNNNTAVIEDRNRKGLPLGRIDFDASLNDLPDEWDLQESKLKNVALFVTKKPVNHPQSYKNAVPTNAFSYYLNIMWEKVSKKDIDDIFNESFLELVQMLGANPLYDVALYLGMKKDSKFENQSLSELKKSYTDLLNAQKVVLSGIPTDVEISEMKKFFVEERMKHPFIRAIQKFESNKLYKRTQHSKVQQLRVTISTMFIRYKQNKIPKDILDLQLKITIQENYEDMPKGIDFPFFGIDDHDKANFSKLVSEVKAQVSEERDLCRFLDEQLSGKTEAELINNEAALITRISTKVANSRYSKRTRQHIEDIYLHHLVSNKRYRIAANDELPNISENIDALKNTYKLLGNVQRLYIQAELHSDAQPNPVSHSIAQVEEPAVSEPIVARMPAAAAGPTLSNKIKNCFHEVYFGTEQSRLQNIKGFEYFIKTLTDFPNEVHPSSIALWVASTGLVIPTLFKNTLKLITEFAPAALETLCDHGADKCRAYIDNENNPNKNIGLAYLGYGACVTGKYIALATRLITMRVTSPITSIQQAYKFGNDTGDSLFGKGSLTGKAMGFALGTLSGCFSLASYIALGIVTAPVIAAVAPAVVGTKITSAVASFSSWLSSVTGPVMGWIGSHITAGLAAIGIKTIGGYSITPSVVALGAAATAVITEMGLFARSGLSYLKKKFGSSSNKVNVLAVDVPAVGAPAGADPAVAAPAGAAVNHAAPAAEPPASPRTMGGSTSMINAFTAATGNPTKPPADASSKSSVPPPAATPSAQPVVSPQATSETSPIWSSSRMNKP